MFNEKEYNKKLKQIHDQVTMPLDEESKQQYELFVKFMHLYESEKNLQSWAFRSCLDKEYETTLDDLS